MHIDYDTKSGRLTRQRCFSELMDLYESNYMQLRCLLPDLDALGARAVSCVPAGLDMHFCLLERSRYTFTFSLSYLFTDAGRGWRAPDLQIRLYQDAQLAEVISGVLHRHYLRVDGIAPEREPAVPPVADVTARWRLNRFLGRWVAFCLRQGHVFRASESLSVLQQRWQRKWHGEAEFPQR